MDPVVVAFGTGLVAAMATDTWQRARDVVVGVWRRVRPSQQAETVNAELEGLRERILVARRTGQAGVEEALVGVWQGRLQELLLEEPGVADDLRRVLAETLSPMLTPAEQTRIGQIVMTGSSHDNSTFNQVAGNQTNIQR